MDVEATTNNNNVSSSSMNINNDNNGQDVFPPPLPRAAELMFAHSTEEKKLYWDRSHYESPESQMKALAQSSTLYIGNMAFSTRSSQVYSHFSQIGPVRQVHMGLDRFLKTPCGFGFVEYARREDALEAVANLSGTKLDGRVIRVELDAGFQPGRQYGRGASGGQVRDDRRRNNDPARTSKQQQQGGSFHSQQQRRGESEGYGGGGDDNNNKAGNDLSYYGGGALDEPGGGGDNRGRDDNTDQDMEGDQPEKNPRFREE